MVLIDQTRLPRELRFVKCRSAEELAKAIERMQIRGAPVLAAAAAMALAVTALRSKAGGKAQMRRELEAAAARVRRTRPTGVNLFVGLKRVLRVARSARDVGEIRAAVVREAKGIADEDVKVNRRMGKHGD